MAKKFVLLFFLTSLILTQFCAKSKKSDAEKDLKLSEIDRLIRRTEYDEALKQLNVYIINNPENFDNAQLRIKKIMNARIEYAKLADKLIQLIINDPENSKEIYEITAQLEKFERHPSDANLQFIADAKKSAEFNYFRAVFVQLQNESSALVQKGEFAAAVQKASEGFWLYKDDFYQKWEDRSEFTGAADSIQDSLNKNLALFESKDYIPKIKDAVEKFIQSVMNDDYKAAIENYKDVKRSFEELNNLKKRIEENSKDFADLFEKIKQEDSDTTDASFLPFMIHFISGLENVEYSGITGAFNGLWNSLAGKMSNAVISRMDFHYEKYCLIENENPKLAEIIRNCGTLEDLVAGLYEIQQQGSSPDCPFKDDVCKADYFVKLSEYCEKLLAVRNQLSAMEQTQAEYLTQFTQGGADKAKIIASLFDLTKNAGTLTGVENDQRLENLAWTKEYAALNKNDFDVLEENYKLLLTKVFEQTAALDVNAWNQIAVFYQQTADSYVAQVEADNKASEKYTAGFYVKLTDVQLGQISRSIKTAVTNAFSYETDPEMDFGIVYAYPDIGQKISVYTDSQADEYIKAVEDTKSMLRNTYSGNLQWKGNQELSAIVENNQNYLENDRLRLLELKKSNSLLAQNAKNKILAAQLARNEADIRFDEAQRALKNNQYENARKKLQEALAKYDESLTNQNDEKLRSDCDKKLQELGERITRGENEYVVVEVRNLKTMAKDAYFNGRFEDAEKYLNQAKLRWADTNTEEDPEITNLMTFVGTAVSMKTGRDILPSSPQYPEMSQLLDIAYEYYNSGSEKLKSGDKAGGEKDLDKALESVQKVQYVYPLNQEASILTLKINKLKDPEKFNEELGQKIEAARFMCKGADTRQEGYANLLDYYELEPDYKGLKELIYQTEIEIGIRQKPVDNSAEKKAKSLLAEGRKLFNQAGNDRAKLEAALAKVNESLILKDDKDASKLKDQITTKIGGTNSTVLSTEDERLYQLAIQRLQNNNIPGANALVQQLLKKPQNMYSQKIKDLQVKIDARS